MIFAIAQILLLALTLLSISSILSSNDYENAGTAFHFTIFFIIAAFFFFEFIICGIGAFFSKKDFYINNLLAGFCVLGSILFICLVIDLFS